MSISPFSQVQEGNVQVPAMFEEQLKEKIQQIIAMPPDTIKHFDKIEVDVNWIPTMHITFTPKV